MSIEFRAIKKLGALRPATPDDAEIMAMLPEGQPVKLTATIRTRSSKHHRWFFGLLGVVAEATSTHIDQIVHMVKIGIGHCDLLIMPKSGEVVYMPRSISFTKMDQQQFNDFADKSVDWLLANLLEGTTDAELRREVAERTGVYMDDPRSEAAGVRAANNAGGGGRSHARALPSEAGGR